MTPGLPANSPFGLFFVSFPEMITEEVMNAYATSIISRAVNHSQPVQLQIVELSVSQNRGLGMQNTVRWERRLTLQCGSTFYSLPDLHFA